MADVYDNFVEWPSPSGEEDFRQRLANRQVKGLVVTPAAQEEWDAAVAAFNAERKTEM